MTEHKTKLGELIGECITLLGYASPADFERRHGYASKTVQHIVSGKTRRPTQMILNRIAVDLRMIPAELHSAAGYGEAAAENASAFGVDLGTQEQIIKRLRLAKGSEPERASFPLGLMHDRGFITFDELRAGLRYSLLHRTMFGKSSAHSALGLLVASEEETEEQQRPRREIGEHEKELLQGLIETEARMMVMGMPRSLRDVFDPVVLEDKFPPFLTREEDWNAPQPGVGGLSRRDVTGMTEVQSLLDQAARAFKGESISDPGAADLSLILEALKFCAKWAAEFHRRRVALHKEFEENDAGTYRAQHASGSF